MTNDDSDRPAAYREFADAYQYPPWLVPQTLTVAQQTVLWRGGAEEDALNHDDAVARVNEARKKKGLPPLSDKLPGQKVSHG